jgi:hypothetical protein
LPAPDKPCILITMSANLAFDQHFEQAGFEALLRRNP